MNRAPEALGKGQLISLSVLLHFHCPACDPQPSLLISDLKEMKVCSCSLRERGVPHTHSSLRDAEGCLGPFPHPKGRRLALS